MRQVRFPPFGFGFSEFGLWEPVLALFLAFFDFRKKSGFERMVQKDAPGPVSPLRVRIFGVWAPGAMFALFLSFFDFRKKTVLERMVQKDAPGPVSPLRVRIFGVRAPGACFGPVFGDFRKYIFKSASRIKKQTTDGRLRGINSRDSDFPRKRQKR